MSTGVKCNGHPEVSLNPEGAVTAKPYHDDIRLDLRAEAKTKLMENIGYQNDHSARRAGSSSSSTVELHHVTKTPHPCNAESCRRANTKAMPSPWHHLKSVFLIVLIVLFVLWLMLMAVLLGRNAL